MPWTVRLEDEEGVQQSDDYLVLESGLLPTGRDYPLSSLIEASPYYDTLLNPVQVKALLLEIDSVDAASASTLEKLRSIVRQIAPHVYLRFIGD